MATQVPVKAVITADDRASSTLKNFGNSVERTNRSFNKAAKAAAIGLAAAGAAAVAFGVSAVKAFSESEQVMAQTNAVLKSTKNVAGVTAKQVSKIATSLQNVTKFSDETIQSGENLLLTFTKIGKDIFPEATEVMLDMSQALGQDVKASAVQLGKALQDPILGVTALRRVGVNFSTAQRDVIENLVKTGQSAEAQRLILKELQTEFGGSAKAAGETFAGKLEILKNQFDDIKESIGKVIVEALSPLAARLSTFVAGDQFQNWLKQLTVWLQVNLPIAINYIVNELIPNLINIFNALWPTVKVVLSAFAALIGFLASHTWVVKTLAAAFIALKVAMAISAAVNAFRAGMAAVRGSIATTKTALVAFRALAASPVAMGAIGVGAAIASIYLVYRALQEVRQAIIDVNNAAAASASHSRAQSDTLSRLRKLRDTGTPEQRARAQRALKGAGGYASGTDFAPGGMTLVGERGAEMVDLPRGSKVHQADRTKKMGGGNTIINITVPMLTGSANERRKVARMLIKDLQDIAAMNGKNVTDMLSSNYGLVS